MAPPLLTLQGVRVRYDQVEVLRVSQLAIDTGEILAVIGPNGAGKSTLLRVMGLVQRPTQGNVLFQGQAVIPARALALRRRMASVFQEPLLLNASVYDNVALGLTLRHVSRRVIQRRVQLWMERLGIAHLQRRSARGLSGGEAQRTSLARALALEPDLLLLDEPFAALDPPSREALLLDLEVILRDTNTTTVFVTHERNEALTLGDRVAVLLGGELVQEGPPWQVFSEPLNETIARFVGADINVPGTVSARTCGTVIVTTPIGQVEVAVELPCGARVTLCLRPEDLTLWRMAQSPHPSSARNVLPGTITRLVPWGSQVRVTINAGVPLTALVTRRSVTEMALTVGMAVWISFKASAVHVIRHHSGEPDVSPA